MSAESARMASEVTCGPPPGSERWPHPVIADVGPTSLGLNPEIPLSVLLGASGSAIGGATTHAQPVPRRSTYGAEARVQVWPFLALETTRR
jgi:hypothetical protein